MALSVRILPPEHNAAALELWEASVRATHHFVSEAHVQQYRAMVRDVLESRPLDIYGLYAAAPEGESVFQASSPALLAIMGVEPEDAMLGLLFVAADQRGRGYGSVLLDHAFTLGVRKVDVNEQNVEARAFYERKGFTAQSVSPVDGVGNPYPLVHMMVG